MELEILNNFIFTYWMSLIVGGVIAIVMGLVWWEEEVTHKVVAGIVTFLLVSTFFAGLGLYNGREKIREKIQAQHTTYYSNSTGGSIEKH